MSIKEKYVEVSLGAKNIKHFEELGYIIPRKRKYGRTRVERGTKIIVKTEHLLHTSECKLTKLCDICGDESQNRTYNEIISRRNAGDGLDRCRKCGWKNGADKLKNNTPYSKSFEFKAAAQLTKEWDWNSNSKKPSEVSCGSNHKVNWICTDCKSLYSMSPANRFRGKTCPYCAESKLNESKSLSVCFPHLIDSWDYSKNNNISPEKVNSSSQKNAWWKCNACNSGYLMKIKVRVNAAGCPYCDGKRVNESNSLSALYPALLKEWLYERNDEIGLFPDKVTSKSGKKAWWKCPTCQYEWLCNIDRRTCSKSGCIICSGKYLKSTDEFKQEVYNLTKGDYQVTSEYKGTINKIKILHVHCGHLYSVKPTDFLSGKRCPFCKLNKGELYISRFLDLNSIKMEPQYSHSDCKYIRPLPFDFAIFNNQEQLQCLIEYDGEHHFKPVMHWGGEKAFKLQQKKDKIKDDYCKFNNIPLIRIPYWDFKNIDSILTERLTELSVLSPALVEA